MTDSKKQARRWCFTLNNYTDEEIDRLKNWKTVDYIIYGKEIGENGTPHLQGYVELGHPVKLTTLKNILKRAHWECAKGNSTSNIAYCSKDNDTFSQGEIKHQGGRVDIVQAKELAVTGGMRAVTMEAVNFQAIRIAEKFLSYHEKPRDWKPEVFWYWGPTGTGKSRTAREQCSTDVYIKNSESKWWDGYDGHKDVIIDDFRDSWWTLTYMLGLLDRYAFRIEQKGGTREFTPKRIWITSAFEPLSMYKGTGEAREQLIRRICLIRHFPSLTTPLTTEVGGVILGPPTSPDNVDYGYDDDFDDEWIKEPITGVEGKWSIANELLEDQIQNEIEEEMINSFIDDWSDA